MEVMKLLLELSEQVQAKQGEKADLREKVDDVDQAVAQILGEIQKAAAACSHRRCVTSMLCFRSCLWQGPERPPPPACKGGRSPALNRPPSHK